MPDLAAIILAAGGSSRMGRPKQLLRFDGRTLLARAVATARSVGCDPVVVVLGRDADACKAEASDAVVVTNDAWASGMGSSLRLGALAVPPSATRALILLCDQPRVSSATLERLIEASDRTGAACVAAYAQTLGPPALVDRVMLDRLQNWTHTHGAKALWTNSHSAVERVACPEAATDVDTPDDYERVCRSPQ